MYDDDVMIRIGEDIIILFGVWSLPIWSKGNDGKQVGDDDDDEKEVSAVVM